MPHFHLQNFSSKDDTIFCGVFDGHGPNGHLVAKRVRDLLPLKLSANLGWNNYKYPSSSTVITETTRGSTTQHGDEDNDASHGNGENGEYPAIFTALRASFLRAFYVVDRDLKMHKNIDSTFSGTTAVTVIKQVEINFSFLIHDSKLLFLFFFFQKHNSDFFILLFLQGGNLIIGNLGDSRAVLGTRNENNQLVALQLTVDLKPNIPSMFLHERYYSKVFYMIIA
jgi:serine/threonine protein phosphatase PrpC